MRATNTPIRFHLVKEKQRGVAVVEFALVALPFFILLFAAVELARAMYICNTLQEVTRRAAALAANTNFRDSTALQKVRERAIFRESPGFLAFAEPVSEAKIQIDYMRIERDGGILKMVAIPEGDLPASPAANYANCLNDPYGLSCIRLVRVRVCETATADSCAPVRYRSLISITQIPFGLPSSTTIRPAESLGLPAGTPSDPCGCT